MDTSAKKIDGKNYTLMIKRLIVFGVMLVILVGGVCATVGEPSTNSNEELKQKFIEAIQGKESSKREIKSDDSFPNYLDKKEYEDGMTSPNGCCFGPYQFDIPTARDRAVRGGYTGDIDLTKDIAVKYGLFYDKEFNEFVMDQQVNFLYDMFGKKDGTFNPNTIKSMAAGHYANPVVVLNSFRIEYGDLDDYSGKDINELAKLPSGKWLTKPQIITTSDGRQITAPSVLGYANSIHDSVYGIPSSCLLPSTKITLHNNSYKQIRDVKIGDKVLSYDFKRNKAVNSTVLNIFSRAENEYLIINKRLKVTPYHYVYAKRKRAIC